MATLFLIVSLFISITEGYISSSNQYHIQTDTGNERFFKFKTQNGQYRKERRLSDGTVIGSSSWIDANGNQHVQEYKADAKGYRITKAYTEFVGLLNVAETTSTTTTKRYNDRFRQRQQGITFAKKYKYLVPMKSTMATSSATATATTAAAIESVTERKTIKRKRVVIKKRKPLINLNYNHGNHSNTNNDNNNFDYSAHPIYDHKKERLGSKNKWKIRRNLAKSPNNTVHYSDKKQFHFQSRNQNNEMVGQYGYIDPFGIRRIVYYYASPQKGYIHQKRNKYIGLKH